MKKDKPFEDSSLIDASIDSVITLNPDFQVKVWNNMCEITSGKSRNEVLDKPLSEVLPLLMKKPVFVSALKQSLEGRKSFLSYDEGAAIADHMETHVIPLKNSADAVNGIMIICHDIAHRLHAEQELKRLNKILEEKNRQLENQNIELVTFSRITSHDLKEPLRKIGIFSKMITDEEIHSLTPNAISLFRRIAKAAGRAEELTDDIYDYMHLQQITEPVTEVDLNLIIKISRNKLSALIGESNAVIESKQLAVVKGYWRLLELLFINIIENAIKFQQAGNQPRIEIQTKIVDAPQKGADSQRYIELCFEDNGIGFEPQYKHQVFELFRRLHRVEDFSGTGIGLPICKKIMDLHQGYLNAESTMGKGSTFCCYFPVE